MEVHQGSPQWLWTVGLGESIAFQLLVKPECILQAACSTDWEECRRFMPGKLLTPLMRPLCGQPEIEAFRLSTPVCGQDNQRPM
jgi:hypothetical protein